VSTGPSRSPDASLALEPGLFYGLAAGRLTPKAVRARAEIEGEPGIADQVLTALSGVVADVTTPA
jgi:hypothetical protein